jgi:hypothetical protein
MITLDSGFEADLRQRAADLLEPWLIDGGDEED